MDDHHDDHCEEHCHLSSQHFLTIFSEFQHVDPATLKVYLRLASCRTPPSVWGESTQYATALLTAHMLTASGKQGSGPTGGTITAEQVGDLSRSFESIAEIGSGDAPLMVTRYGIDYVALRKERIVGAQPVHTPRHPHLHHLYFPGRR